MRNSNSDINDSNSVSSVTYFCSYEAAINQQRALMAQRVEKERRESRKGHSRGERESKTGE